MRLINALTKEKHLDNLPAGTAVYLSNYYKDKLAKFYFKDKIVCRNEQCSKRKSHCCAYRLYANRDNGIYSSIRTCDVSFVEAYLDEEGTIPIKYEVKKDE